MTRRKIEIPTGSRFGKWTTISDSRVISGRKFNRCICDCGMEQEVSSQRLMAGGTGQCKACTLRNAAAGRTRHGAARGRTVTPEYGCWLGMKSRCNNENDRAYPSYGGRGIAICARWESFENFLEDMGPRPQAGMSIERCDNSKGYDPDNCKWASPKQQCRNRRTSLIVTDGSDRITLAEAVERRGHAPGSSFYKKAHVRITKRGWDAERALSTP